jgi:hypothetical protein
MEEPQGNACLALWMRSGGLIYGRTGISQVNVVSINDPSIIQAIAWNYIVFSGMRDAIEFGSCWFGLSMSSNHLLNETSLTPAS